MTIQPDPTSVKTHFQGNDKLLFGMIMGVIAFWLFAQTTLKYCTRYGARFWRPCFWYYEYCCINYSFIFRGCLLSLWVVLQIVSAV